MNCFRRCLGERCADVFDWIDYRRDANGWPLFALPPMLSVAWAYGGTIGLEVITGAALLVTLAIAAVSVVTGFAWIVANAALDFVSSLRIQIPGPVAARQNALTR